MKLIAKIFTGTELPREMLLDQGDENASLEARFEDVLPGHEIIGIFVYPALKQIEVHARAI